MEKISQTVSSEHCVGSPAVALNTPEMSQPPGAVPRSLGGHSHPEAAPLGTAAPALSHGHEKLEDPWEF